MGMTITEKILARAAGKEKVRPAESYLAPCDFTLGDGDNSYDIIKGTWLLGTRIVDDELWKQVKAGELGAYSIGGTAIREEADEQGGGDE